MSKSSRDELLAQISDLIRAQQVTADRFDDSAAEVLGINRTDHRALDVIERMGPIGAGDLARETGLSPAAMTSSIDRLEKAGYARRVPDPSDRRRILVETDPGGRERAWKIYGPMEGAFSEAMQSYSTRDLVLLTDFLERAMELGNGQLARVEKLAARRRRSD